ncbi:MAG TPA: MASE3 domain-containing protein, partial [Sulfuricurvum sp.]|nr:MASE3 domain-containing protein [Sulfuricurvum sp.]
MLESWLPKGSKCFSLHHTHYPSIRNVAIIILLMFMGMIAIALIPPIIELRGLKDYLPLHTALETVSIIIAMLIFAVGWNTYSNKLPFNIVLISTVFFGVAVFDFTHVISYKGMPDFVTPSSVEKGIDFWLSARVLSSVGLLLFIFLPLRPITSRIYKYLLLTAIFIVLGIVHWLVLYQHDLFPHLFFVQGHGLTPLKIS